MMTDKLPAGTIFLEELQALFKQGK